MHSFAATHAMNAVLRTIAVVDETVDSPLLVAVGRLVRLADDDKDESLALRGRLSMDDCEDAVG
jgi:hypothetical protein